MVPIDSCFGRTNDSRRWTAHDFEEIISLDERAGYAAEDDVCGWRNVWRYGEAFCPYMFKTTTHINF